MWLNDCTQEEQTILMALASLMAQLPNPLTDYTDALAEINRRYFNTPTPRRPRDLNPIPGSLSIKKSPVAASPRYGT